MVAPVAVSYQCCQSVAWRVTGAQMNLTAGLWRRGFAFCYPLQPKPPARHKAHFGPHPAGADTLRAFDMSKPAWELWRFIMGKM